MCKYKEMEKLTLSNGKTVKQVNDDVSKEIEKIYLESWAKGISVPFWDDEGNTYLANPDGSEDKVLLNRELREYSVISRSANPGMGRYAYLLRK